MIVVPGRPQNVGKGSFASCVWTAVLGRVETANGRGQPQAAAQPLILKGRSEYRSGRTQSSPRTNSSHPLAKVVRIGRFVLDYKLELISPTHIGVK